MATKTVYMWGVDSTGNNTLIPVNVTNGAAFVADVGIPNQRHNRFLEGIDSTWPGS